MAAFLRSLLVGVAYPMVPIVAELLIRSNSEVRLETWFITAVVYIAAMGLVSSSRVVSDISLWFAGIAAIAYGAIAFSLQIENLKLPAEVTDRIKSFSSNLPVFSQGTQACQIIMLAFTIGYIIERIRRHIVEGEDFG